MEWLFRYFQWGHKSMPKYLGFLALVLALIAGIQWDHGSIPKYMTLLAAVLALIAYIMVEGHALQERNSANYEIKGLSSAIQSLKGENSELRSAASERKEFERTTPSGNISIVKSNDVWVIEFSDLPTIPLFFEWRLKIHQSKHPHIGGTREHWADEPISLGEPIDGKVAIPFEKLSTGSYYSQFIEGGCFIQYKFTLENGLSHRHSKVWQGSFRYDLESKEVLIDER